MKTVGLLGGMSWESTQRYYQLLNQLYCAKLGKHHSIEAILYSVDFERILALVHQDDWKSIEQEMIRLAKKLQTAGADFLILTSNAIHKIFPQTEAALHIPMIHIADPIGKVENFTPLSPVSFKNTSVNWEKLDRGWTIWCCWKTGHLRVNT